MISPFTSIREKPERELSLKSSNIIVKKSDIPTNELIENMGFEDGSIRLNYLVKESVRKWKNANVILKNLY